MKFGRQIPAFSTQVCVNVSYDTGRRIRQHVLLIILHRCDGVANYIWCNLI